jgi:o-succinylbenzoate synthase
VKRALLRLSIPFRHPLVTAFGEFETRELVLMRLTADDGTEGYGEAAPLPGYDRATITECIDALRSGSPGRPPQAAACLELAEADLAGRLAGVPAVAGAAGDVEVNCTLHAGPLEETAARAREQAARGFGCFKLKVGLPDDADRVAAVRDAIGPDPRLRLDANGVWDAREAVVAIRSLQPHGLELVEQPCRTLGEMSEVRRAVDVPIAADESIAGAGDVRAAAEDSACDLVCVKLGASGGIAGARAALREAEHAGLGAYVTSTVDGPWAVAAALQLAATERVTAACGLATLDLFDAAIAAALPPASGGRMQVPAGPGLGVELAPGALHEVLVEELED